MFLARWNGARPRHCLGAQASRLHAVP